MGQFFINIYYILRKRRTTTLSVIILTFFLLIWQASQIQLNESISTMLPHDKANTSIIGTLEETTFSDKILVMVSRKDTTDSADRSILITIADELVQQIKSIEGVKEIQYATNDSIINSLITIIHNNIPIFLNEDDYSLIDSLITEQGIQNIQKTNYNRLVSPQALFFKDNISRDPLGLNYFVLNKFKNFSSNDNFQLYNNKLLSEDGHHLIFNFNSDYSTRETNLNAILFDSLDHQINNLELKYPEIEIHYFGAPLVSAGNAEQIRSDVNFTVILTILLLFIIFLFQFRKISAPIIILIPALFGALLSLAIISWLQGGLSIIALGSGSLVLGIAVNYSLHFLIQNQFNQNIATTIEDLAFPLIAGSLTTIVGFLCLQFTNSPVLQDLGLFTAISLTGAALSTLIILPHLLNPKPRQTTSIALQFLKNNPSWHKFKQYSIFILLILTPFFAYKAQFISFESDMNNLNFMSDKTKQSEKFISRFTSQYAKTLYLNTTANTIDEALESMENISSTINTLNNSNLIKNYTIPSDIIPSIKEQRRRISLWNSYWQQDKSNEIYNNLLKYGKINKFKDDAFVSFKSHLDADFKPLTDLNRTFLQKYFLEPYIKQSNNNVKITGLIYTNPEHVKRVYDYLNKYKNIQVFDRQYLTNLLVNSVSQDFNFIALWTSLLVFFSLLIIYGRLELAIISFVPMLLSWTWILGLMALFELKFNVVNIVLSTLIFALGDDYCIFTTDRLQKKYINKNRIENHTSLSISLSAITTIIGMGVLGFAKHPALNSIALVSIIGISAVWLKSQLIQPWLFNLLITNPTSNNHPPYTIINTFKSIFAFSYFAIGSLLASLIGYIIFYLIPGKKKNRKYLLHVVISKFCYTVVYMMTSVKKVIINPNQESFSKPALIIANHSSVLDILFLALLHPKLILITNKWVWNSPVFGKLVRLAEYQQITDGVDPVLDNLRKSVHDGYSIVIFPEGTRSPDGEIKRFHKGAFYIAEALHLDILPILIHGTSSVVKKGYFYVNNGTMTLKFLPRISPDDTIFGLTYSDRTKAIGAWFRQEFKSLSSEIEVPAYFKNQLFTNYIYKGPVLEWYMRVKVKLENNYKLFNNLVPSSGSIIDIGCGYGFLSYILGYTSPYRSITSIDYDSDKIKIAQSGYSKPSNVTFIHADILKYTFNKTDTFILNDILHYLLPEEQKLVLENCISNLTETGKIIIREGDSSLQHRHWWTRLTEFLSTKVFRFNQKKSYGLHFMSRDWLVNLASSNHLQLNILDPSSRTSNLIFILSKQ